MTGKVHTELQRIIAYEQGQLSFREIVDLFADLIKKGLVWELQGSYGRTANDLIGSGIVSSEGVIDEDAYEELIQ